METKREQKCPAVALDEPTATKGGLHAPAG